MSFEFPAYRPRYEKGPTGEKEIRTEFGHLTDWMKSLERWVRDCNLAPTTVTERIVTLVTNTLTLTNQYEQYLTAPTGGIVEGSLYGYSGSGVALASAATAAPVLAAGVCIETQSAGQLFKHASWGTRVVRLESGAAVARGDELFVSATEAGRATPTPPASGVRQIVGIVAGAAVGGLVQTALVISPNVVRRA